MSNKLLTDETGQLILQAIKELDTVALNKIGNLTSLNMLDKSSLVVAINELLTQRGALSDLNTTNKASIIAAINELVSADASIIAAINELVSADASISSTVTTLDTRTSMFAKKSMWMRNSLFHYVYGGNSQSSFTSADLDNLRNGDSIQLYKQWNVPGFRSVQVVGFCMMQNQDYSPRTHMICAANVPYVKYNTDATVNPRYTQSYWYTDVRPVWLEKLENFFGAENLLTWPCTELVFSDSTHECTGTAGFTGKLELPTATQLWGWPRFFNGQVVQAKGNSYENVQMPLYSYMPKQIEGCARDAIAWSATGNPTILYGDYNTQARPFGMNNAYMYLTALFLVG